MRTVAQAYDQLAPRFGEWSASVVGDPWEQFVEQLESLLPKHASVLDLGCGSGSKTKRLTRWFEVIAVDVSTEQLRLAREEAPDATFLQADFAEVDFPDETFAAVVALYSFVHVPRAEHVRLFASVRRWLKPGGLFLASLGHVGGPDRVEAWLGVEMFFSGWDADTNRRLVRSAGFEVLADDVLFMREPGHGDVGFLWMLARRP
ncbi:MAG TPA: methyltransferase domain-containing protein [Gaiellaceae bacterium]|jgi:SAM-dependent methyltransferase